MSVKKDPFTVLGIDRSNFKKDDLKSRYLDMVKQYPPEKKPEKYEEIRRAYDAMRKASSPYDVLALAPLGLVDKSLSRGEVIQGLEEDLGISRDKVNLKRKIMLNKLEEIINDTRD